VLDSGAVGPGFKSQPRRSPDPLAVLKGPTSNGGRGRGREGEWKGREREREGEG